MGKKRSKQDAPSGSLDDSDEFISPRNLSEQLIEALRNKEVVEGLGKALEPIVIKIVQQTVSTLLDAVNSSLKGILEDNKKLNEKVRVVAEENQAMKTRLSAAESQLDNFERERRLNSIVIRGLPEGSYGERATAAVITGEASSGTRHASVAETVIDMCRRDLNIQIQTQDVVEAFRMKPGPKDNCRPVLIKFANQRVRQELMSKKKVLREANRQIYFSDHLTKPIADMFAKARALVREKKLHAAWTYKGQLFVKRSPEPTARGSLVKSVNDLPH